MDACDERLIVLVPRFNATVAVRGSASWTRASQCRACLQSCSYGCRGVASGSIRFCKARPAIRVMSSVTPLWPAGRLHKAGIDRSFVFVRQPRHPRGAHVHVHQSAGHHADPRGQHILLKRYSGQAKRVVEHVEWKHRGKPRQQHNLPALLFQRRGLWRRNVGFVATLRATQSPARYRPTRKETVAPSVAESETRMEPMTTPKTAPAPNVRIEPGTNSTQART